MYDIQMFASNSEANEKEYETERKVGKKHETCVFGKEIQQNNRENNNPESIRE